jgi:short-subunit dehydrogenase
LPKVAREINGMNVVITGASGGIGAALARELVAKGARVVIAARRLPKLQELANLLGTDRVIPIRADVSLDEDCKNLMAESAKALGRIDTLVCNAGYGLLRSVAETSRAQMQNIFATNVLGTTDCVRYVVPLMLKQEPRDGWRGQIMIVSSAAGRRGLPYFGAYSATKFAQLGLAEALRVELRPRLIAVSSVHPVTTDTDFFSTAEREGHGKMPPRGSGEVVQSATTVAKKMTAAIRRPRPEVWPFRPARIGLGFAALMPRITDRAMAAAFKQFQRVQPQSSDASADAHHAGETA